MIFFFIIYLDLLLITEIVSDDGSCNQFLSRLKCVNQTNLNCEWQKSMGVQCQDIQLDSFCSNVISYSACLNNQAYLCQWDYKTASCQSIDPSTLRNCTSQTISNLLCQGISSQCQFSSGNCSYRDQCNQYMSKFLCMESNSSSCAWDQQQSLCYSCQNECQASCSQQNKASCFQNNLCAYDNQQKICISFTPNISCESAQNINQCQNVDRICIWNASNSTCMTLRMDTFANNQTCQPNYNKKACQLSPGLCQYLISQKQSYCSVLSINASCFQQNQHACNQSGYCYWTGLSCVNDNCNYNVNQQQCLQDNINLCMWNGVNCSRSTIIGCSKSHSLLQSQGSCMNQNSACIWKLNDQICYDQKDLSFCSIQGGLLNSNACKNANVPCVFLLHKCTQFKDSINSYLQAYNQAACPLNNKWIEGRCTSALEYP